MKEIGRGLKALRWQFQIMPLALALWIVLSIFIGMAISGTNTIWKPTTVTMMTKTDQSISGNTLQQGTYTVGGHTYVNWVNAGNGFNKGDLDECYINSKGQIYNHCGYPGPNAYNQWWIGFGIVAGSVLLLVWLFSWALLSQHREKVEDAQLRELNLDRRLNSEPELDRLPREPNWIQRLRQKRQERREFKHMIKDLRTMT